MQQPRAWNIARPVFRLALLSLGGMAGPACVEAVTESRGDTPVGPWTSVSVGASFVCGTTTDMRAYCWGSNEAGQLGAQTSETCSSGPCATRPVRVSGPSTWSSITTGAAHTCGLTSSGDAYCWGSNFWGQVGNGSRSEANETRTPVPVVGGLTFAFIAAGGHTCGVTQEGRAYCWGSNAIDQLGVGPTVLGPQNCTATIHPCSRTPAAVTGSLRFTTLSPGPGYTCGIAVDRAAYCWGDNTWGQLGTGGTERANAPARVSGGLAFRTMSTGGIATVAGLAAITCGVTTEGAAYCWGSNRHGELGSGVRRAVDNDPPGRSRPGLVLPPEEN